MRPVGCQYRTLYQVTGVGPKAFQQAAGFLRVYGSADPLDATSVLVRIHFIIVMIRWTGLAPLEFEFPFPGSLTSTFLQQVHPESYKAAKTLIKKVSGGATQGAGLIPEGAQASADTRRSSSSLCYSQA